MLVLNLMRRASFIVMAALAVGVLVSACEGGGDSGTANVDGDGGSNGSVDGSTTGDGAVSNTADGGTSVDLDGASSDATGDAKPDAPTSCVTKSVVIALIATSAGQCSFAFNQPYDAEKINLLLTPGWGQVCYAGSSSGCGSGASADGWWFSAPGEISVCDATCARFEKQTIAGKLTVQLGCATKDCTH